MNSVLFSVVCWISIVTVCHGLNCYDCSWTRASSSKSSYCRDVKNVPADAKMKNCLSCETNTMHKDTGELASVTRTCQLLVKNPDQCDKFKAMDISTESCACSRDLCNSKVPSDTYDILSSSAGRAGSSWLMLLWSAVAMLAVLCH